MAPLLYNENAGGNIWGFVQATGAAVLLAKNTITQWAASTNATTFFADVTFEVN